MSIIDFDNPSRMAVFPTGGKRWADPSQSHRCRGERYRGGGVEDISLSLCVTHAPIILST